MYPTPSLGPCIDGVVLDAFCQTDNSSLTTFRQASIGIYGSTNIVSILQYQFDPTDLNVIFSTTPSYAGDSETDIIYQAGPGVPSGLDGITWCDDAVSAVKCDQHYIRFLSSSPGTPLSSHETGHAVGLAHPQNANPQQQANDVRFQTMVTPVFTPVLGAHNIQQINSTY
jgi:hypothetical protein